ncbi:MAG: hypothetical protein R6X19_07060 [Kiritimatiellia bacterium]
MEDKLIFTAKELAFLRELTRNKVPFIVVGLSAAALQGAPMVTQDVDLWFLDINHPGIRKALMKLGGTLVPPIGLNPPVFSGKHVDCFDIVLTVHGVGKFEREMKTAIDVSLGSFFVKVLPLDRIIASKKFLNREKDRMVLPALKAAAKAVAR